MADKHLLDQVGPLEHHLESLGGSEGSLVIELEFELFFLVIMFEFKDCFHEKKGSFYYRYILPYSMVFFIKKRSIPLKSGQVNRATTKISFSLDSGFPPGRRPYWAGGRRNDEKYSLALPYALCPLPP